MIISIIIPTYNRNTILYKHLSIAYTALQGLDYEIIVINDSKNNTVDIPAEWSKHISVVNNPKQGVASARNLGASLAKSEKLLFIDDDMIINRRSVDRAIAFLDEHKNACLNINWLYPDDLNNNLEAYQFGRYLIHFGFTTLRGWLGAAFDWQENQLQKVGLAASYFLAMSRECFEKSGKYDENFPFSGYEDHDFAVRLNRNGINSYLDTGYLVWHNEADRVQLGGWMQRKYRGGQTQKVAVSMGHKDVAIHYSKLKANIYFLISKVDFIFEIALKLIPNYKIFDLLYFRIVNILLGINLYKGYTK
jgi:GT2 family glycosyltransferase